MAGETGTAKTPRDAKAAKEQRLDEARGSRRQRVPGSARGTCKVFFKAVYRGSLRPATTA